MASNTKDQARTDASLKKKELQAREASKAMAEYEAASRAMISVRVSIPVKFRYSRLKSFAR